MGLPCASRQSSRAVPLSGADDSEPQHLSPMLDVEGHENSSGKHQQARCEHSEAALHLPLLWLSRATGSSLLHHEFPLHMAPGRRMSSCR